MRNVSRAWAYETGLATGVELGRGRCIPVTKMQRKLILYLDIPVNEYYEYFGPDYQLDVKASNTDDLNTPAYLERVKNIVMDHLRHVGGPPSVQMTGTYSSLADRVMVLIERSRCSDVTNRRRNG
jgi:histone deacetylase 1/2